MKEEMMKSHCLHADETPVNVQKDGRPAGSKSYFWVYRTEAQLEKTDDIILYDVTGKIKVTNLCKQDSPILVTF